MTLIIIWTKKHGLKSKYHPGIIKEFEKDRFDIASSLKFRNTTDSFQKQLKEDASSINSSPDVLIFADKTSNIYKARPERAYKKLLKNNVTKTCKKFSDLLEKSINMEAKHIAKKLELTDRIEDLERNPAFITLKDHKKILAQSYHAVLLTLQKANLRKQANQNWKKSTK